jgi:hypothetical protein
MTQLTPVCFYCGEPAETIDHVVPQSMIQDLRILDDEAVATALIHRNRVMEVDCCSDCNSRLGSTYSRNLDERRELLKGLLRRKHQRLLGMPEWTDSELGRLGPTLQRFILARLAEQAKVRRRLAYRGPATRHGIRQG